MTNDDFECFKEVMQHEIPQCSTQLSAFAYKVDGKTGIKMALNIRDGGGNHSKSCDYFYPYAQKQFCVEFSDLFQQQQNVQQRNQKLDLAILKSKISEYKSVCKLLSFENELLNEMIGKVSDTDFILRYLDQQKHQAEFLHPQTAFLIVWHNPDNLSVDLARLLDDLSGRIKSDLSRKNLKFIPANSLFFVTLEDFIHRYE